MLEEHVYVPPFFLPYALDPALQRRVGVRGPSQPQVAPIRGRNERDLQLIPGVRDAKRRPALAQKPEDLFVKPRRMAELECRAAPRRESREEVTQSRRVLLEVRRQLQQDGAEASLQRADDFE